MKTQIGSNIVIKKQSLLLTIVLSVVLVICGYLLFQNEARKIINQKEQTLSAIATLKAEQIENWYKGELEDARIISSNAHLSLLLENFHNNKSSITERELQNFLHQTRKEHTYSDIIIVDLNRNVISSTNNQIIVLDPAEIRQLENAISQRICVSTDLFVGSESGQIKISFISTINNVDMTPEYGIIFRWNPEVFLFPLVKKWPIISRTSESYIFRVEQDTVIYLNPLRHTQNEPLKFKLPITKSELPGLKALSGFSGVTSGVDYRNQDVVAYVSSINGTPWYLVSKIDKSELLADLPKLAFFIVSFTLLCILLVLLSTIYIHNQRQKSVYQKLYVKEKEQWQHQEKFKVIMESVGEGVITIDLHGKVQFLNNRAEELTGWKLRDAKGRDFHNIYNVKSEETGEKENNIMEKVINQGIVKELANHTILVSKSGNEIPVMDTGAPILNSEGELIGIAITFQDETERRIQRRLLIESEEKYKSLVETSQDAIFVNCNNKIEYINPAGIKLLAARSADQIIGKSPFDIFHPDYHDLIKSRISEISLGTEVPILEEKIINFNGATVDVEVIAIPLNFNGEAAIQVSLRDITEKKKMTDDLILAKEKAEESNRLKTAFLQNLSHEIRTPMNGIIGFTQLLKGSTKDPETFIRYIDIIDKSGERLINIINDLVDLSKIESGLISIDNQEFDVNTLVEELYQFFLPQAEKKGLNFELVKQPILHNGSFVTDKIKVYQILSNLINNAIKFTEEGSVSIGYGLENEILSFYIKDTGMGIPTEKQDIIFERFIQADTSINRGYEGAGLGLAISKAFVEKIGGKIGVESEYGKGSTFFVTIPGNGKSIIIPSSIAEDCTVDELSNDGHLKILIAEDDFASSQLIETMFNPLCREIIKANNGSEAIKKCRENSDLDVVLMDLKMPILDGLSATKEIRNFNKDVIIIAQTAYAFPGDMEKAFESGCNDYITKPINPPDLFKVIQKHLKTKK